jgi:tetratricopeptide (TPR) repeat protein
LHSERGDAQQEAARLSNLGGVLQMHDRYFEAQQYYERALERTEQSASEPWAAARRTIVRHNLATLYQRVGRYERALDLYAGIASGENLTPPEQARLFANMGALYRRLGDPYKAVEIYSRAEALAVAEHDLPLRVGVLINRGIALALDLNRLAEAEATFDEVIRVADSLGDRRQQLHGLLYRAETRRRSQRLEEAEQDFEQARVQAERLGLIEERWKALYGLGRIAEARGDADRAEGQYREAISWIESLRSRLEADTLRRELLADRNEPYNALIEVLLRSPRADPECRDIEFCSEALSWISLGRFRNLRDQERSQRLSPNNDLQPRREELHAAWKSRLTASPGERPDLDARIETLEREYEAAERGVGDRGSQSAAPGGVAEVQRNLDPNAVLLVFWTGEYSLLRMWITVEGAGYRFGEFTRSSRRFVREYSEAISDPTGAWHGLAAQVGELLLSDIPALADERRSSLLVLPDAALHEAPLEALVMPGRDALVIERWSVTDVLVPQWAMPKPGGRRSASKPRALKTAVCSAGRTNSTSKACCNRSQPGLVQESGRSAVAT